MVVRRRSLPGRRARTGWALLALLLLAGRTTPAAAQRAGSDELAWSALTDLPGWWSEFGRPGWTPDSWTMNGFPWQFAGHAIGGWRASEPARAPWIRVWPGVAGAGVPLPWRDSLAVVTGEGGAWDGFASGLADARGIDLVPVGGKARGVLSLTNGTQNDDQYALAIARGDTRTWLRMGASGGNRGGIGALGLAGRHLWGFDGGVHRGAHRVSGSFAQRGEALDLPLAHDERAGETARGESGALAWRWERGSRYAGATLERAWDERESFGSFGPSRRDAQQARAVLEVGAERGDRALDGRIEWTRSAVRRQQSQAFDTRADAAWAALRGRSRLGDGTLEVGVGGGWHGALEGRERFQLAPSVVYRVAGAGVDGRVFAQRVVVPVWTDLLAGNRRFVQDTWAGGFEAGVHDARGRSLSGTLVLGRTGSRALLDRFPLRDLDLRVGVFDDLRPYRFSLLSVRGAWDGSVFGMGGEGYALGRGRDASQFRVDPNAGARWWAGTHFRLFTGDLDVRLRVEADAVGEREVDLTGERLPAYGSFGATATLTVGDAIITVRARNLEDIRHPEAWADPVSISEALDPTLVPAARGPGREVRTAVTWRLFN